MTDKENLNEYKKMKIERKIASICGCEVFIRTEICKLSPEHAYISLDIAQNQISEALKKHWNLEKVKND